MIPSGDRWNCVGPRPVALYAHGKRNLRSFNIANLDGRNYEGLIVALALAGRGCIVVAPNYAGYDSSTLGYHPFANYDQNAADMIGGVVRVILRLEHVQDVRAIGLSGLHDMRTRQDRSWSRPPKGLVALIHVRPVLDQGVQEGDRGQTCPPDRRDDVAAGRGSGATGSTVL